MRTIRANKPARLVTLVTALLLIFSSSPAFAAPAARPITLNQHGYRVVIHPDGFRYEIRAADGRLLAPAHAESGLRVQRAGTAEPADAVSTRLVSGGRTAVLAVGMDDGSTVTVRISAARHGTAQFSVAPLGGPATVDFRTGPSGPAYGLGDTGAQSDIALPGTPCGGKVEPRATAELTGIVRDDMTNEGSCKRFLSTFVIFRFSSSAGATATWQATVPSGRYKVEVWAPADTRNTSAARYTVAGDEVVVDQLAGGGQWQPLGERDFTDAAAVTLTVSGTGLHRTDAVRFTRTGQVATP